MNDDDISLSAQTAAKYPKATGKLHSAPKRQTCVKPSTATTVR